MRAALSNLREAARPIHFGVDALQIMHAEVSRLNERSSPAKSRAAAVPAPDAITAQVLATPAATLSMGLLARDLSATGAEGGSSFLTLSMKSEKILVVFMKPVPFKISQANTLVRS